MHRIVLILWCQYNYNMKKYKCDKCGKIYDKKGDFTKHKNRKNPCDSLIKNDDTGIMNSDYIKKCLDECICAYCNKKFSQKGAAVYHMKNNCKKIKEIEEQNKLKKEKEVDEQNKLKKEKEINEQKKKLEDDRIKNLEKENNESKKVISELEKKLELITSNLFMHKNNEDNCINVSVKTTKKQVSKALKIAVWNRYIGINKGTAECLCCEYNIISQSSFHCGHIVAEAKGGKMDITNLIPICELCNTSMGTTNFYDFKKSLCSDIVSKKANVKHFKFKETRFF